MTGIEMAVNMAAKMAGIEPEDLRKAILNGIETVARINAKVEDFDRRFTLMEATQEKILRLLQNEFPIVETPTTADAVKLIGE